MQKQPSTRNLGAATSSGFGQYGAYLQRIVESVQADFDRLVDESKTFPPARTYVIVRFVLNSEGRVSRILDVENHSSDLGARICVAAITNRSPYGEWTDDMKAKLNPDGEELVFTFYYQ